MSASCAQLLVAALIAVITVVAVSGLLAVTGLCVTVVGVAVGNADGGGAVVAVAVAGTLVAGGKASAVGSASLLQAANNKHKLTAITQARHNSNRLKPSSPRCVYVDPVMSAMHLMAGDAREWDLIRLQNHRCRHSPANVGL